MKLCNGKLRLGRYIKMARIPILTILTMMFILLIYTNKSSSSATSEQMDSATKLIIEKLYFNTIKQDDLATSLTRFYRILQFFEKNANRINVDGLFGLRIAQGVFIKLKDLNLSTKFDQALNYKLRTTLHSLTKRLSSLADRVTASVKTLTPVYYDQFQLLINRPYIIEDVQVSLLIPNQQKLDDSSPGTNLAKSFDENFSDKCLDLLMKQDVQTGNSSCTTDPQCFEYFLQENASEYFLTHQLLYFIVAQHVSLYVFIYY